MTTIEATATEARSQDLIDLVAILKTQRALRHDFVQPAGHFQAFENGTVRVLGDDPVVTMDETGVHTAAPRYQAGEVFSDGLSARLSIPRKYLRTMAEENPTLWAANLNSWFAHEKNRGTSFLVRSFRDRNTGTAFGRALLSPSYDLGMENLDVLHAALEGVASTGRTVDQGNLVIDRCDLTERRMYVQMHAPDVDVEAANLLAGYRSPWANQEINDRRIITPAQAAEFKRQGDGGHRGFYAAGEEPIVFGGIRIKNSDVGCGAYNIEPMFHFLQCTNGMTIPISMASKAVRKVHLGKRKESGTIQASAETVAARLELLKRETADAVKHFLSKEFVADIIAELSEQSGTVLKDPAETIRVVTRELSITDEVGADILSHFISGGMPTAGGVMQAFTSVAQTMRDGDRAAALEDNAIKALDLAARNALVTA